MPANSEITIRGGYNPFTLKRDHHLDIFSNTVDKITQQHEKALEQQAAIRTALSNVELNAAEDEWKQNYINDISKQIDNAAQFGNYSTALSAATRLAGEAVSNPALRSRQRSNAQYQKEVERIQNDRSLDDLTKQRWMAVNPYYHNDIRNDNGDIVGGSEWKANFNPVADVDINALRNLAVQMTAEESGSRGGTTSRDVLINEKGEETSNFNEAQNVKMHTSSGGTTQWAKKDKEKMARVWNSLKADSKILQGLNQKYETLRWAYQDALNKSTDLSIPEEERARYAREVQSYKSEIADKDGFIYDNSEVWAKARIIPGFADMEYNNRHVSGSSSVSYNQGYLGQRAAAREQATVNSYLTITEDAGVSGTKIGQEFGYSPTWGDHSQFDVLFNK